MVRGHIPGFLLSCHRPRQDFFTPKPGVTITTAQVFKLPNALFVFLCAVPVVLSAPCECVECCDWCVSVRHSLSRAGQVPVSVCLAPSFSHSLSLAPISTSPLYVCMFPPPLFFSCSPPTGAVCIPARRGGGVCDLGSIRTRPPLPRYPTSCSPSPPPWENGCTLLLPRPGTVLPAAAAET